MNDEQLLRYSRHIFLPELGIEGQLALLNSSVLVIGVGGLGAAAVPYLVASGFGRLTLMDDDVVELSNLARQIIHTQSSLGRPKVQSAQQAAQRLNADIQVMTLQQRAEQTWLLEHLAEFDLVLDCSDNAEVRYALNAAALKHQVPWVSGAAVALNGQVTVFDPRQDNSPCYRCLYPEIHTQQLNCSESGVLSPLVGVIGTLQAVEALKILSNIGKPLMGRLLTYDALNASMREWGIKRRADCADCASVLL